MATPLRSAADRNRPPNHERIVEALERVDPTTARALRAMVGDEDVEARLPLRLHAIVAASGVG